MRYFLRRKTGYMSPYTLGMLYPSHKRSEAPIFVTITLPVHPSLIRFPSWIARKLSKR